MRRRPIVSVIVPTYNRALSVKRLVDAFGFQTCSFQNFEVFVVSDGCTDDTVAMLRHNEVPFTLQVLEQSNQGPAAARNFGAEHAKGQLLLFLDDDVEPTASLIEEHLRAHQRKLSQVVIGPYPHAA